MSGPADGLEQRLFAIGDIHGHHTELLGLLDQLRTAGMRPERDTIVFLGDYVDGGPNTCQVLQLLTDLATSNPHWVFLLGNHEQMWLDAYDDEGRPTEEFDTWFYQGGAKTRESYRGERDAERLWPEHRAWVAMLPLYHETDRFIFVHAGLRPPLPPQANSPFDLLWIREEFIYSSHDWGKVVVFGHTPVREPLVAFNKIGIDTMPRDSGKLTAVELTGEEPRFFFQQSEWDKAFIEIGE
jgi:serine/threonine protein phosphatase 1